MLYAFVDDFHFLLFDFPHLSSFYACEELDHLIILYPPVPRTHEYWEGHCPPNYYGGAALGCPFVPHERKIRDRRRRLMKDFKKQLQLKLRHMYRGVYCIC